MELRLITGIERRERELIFIGGEGGRLRVL